jgi:uncharacterized membrane protein
VIVARYYHHAWNRTLEGLKAMHANATGLRDRLEQLTAHEGEILQQLRGRRVAHNVAARHAAQISAGERIADQFAAVMGSWRFIIIQSALLAVWVGLNVTGWARQWDPYPFILLNLMLSFQAAYAAPIIMMSQNRQAMKDRLQAEHDYEVNLKAELEIEDLHAKIDALRQAQWEELLLLQRRQIELLEQLSPRP